MNEIDRQAYKTIKERSHREHKEFNFDFCLILSYCEAYFEIVETFREIRRRKPRLYNVEDALENRCAEIYDTTQETLNRYFLGLSVESIFDCYAEDNHIDFRIDIEN